MLTALDSVQGGMGDPHLPAKLEVRQFAPGLSQVFGQLSIQVVSHDPKTGKKAITYVL